MKILIYDDDPIMSKRWRDRLEKAFTALECDFKVEPLEKNCFEECISQLERRRLDARDNVKITGNNELDEADVLILDYDLLTSETQAFVTGEVAAYLARCYSNCGLIIGLNQYGNNSFDLTLKGHPESFADLNLGDRQIDNPGLWSESNGDWTGFRPWVWPVLPRAAAAFEKRAEELSENLDKPILTFLEFPGEVVKTLPRSAIEFLAGSKPVEQRTFRDFVLDKKTKNGLRGRDEPMSERAVARIAAARIWKWLERLVLPGQDILVDAPHLVSRYPSLLKDDNDGLANWNKTASFLEAKKLGIDYRKVSTFKFPKENWLSRPAWFWQKVSNHNKIDEVASPWTTERPDWVFGEDGSRFLPRKAAREFVADLSSPFVRRFVVNSVSKVVDPQGKRYAKSIKGVDFRPLVRFSL